MCLDGQQDLVLIFAQMYSTTSGPTRRIFIFDKVSNYNFLYLKF